MSVINTPAQMLADADLLAAEFRRVAADIEGSAVDPTFKAQWRAFAEEWGAFYQEISDGVSGYLDRLWGGTQERIDGYRTALREWQARFTGHGGTSTGPTVAKPTETGNPLGDLKWIVLGAALLYAVILYGRAK